MTFAYLPSDPPAQGEHALRSVDPGPWQQATRLARELGVSFDLGERMQRGVELAVELVAGCEHAAVSVIDKAAMHTEAGSSELVWQVEALQYELYEGPCLDSAATPTAVHSSDIRTDRRWPRWGPAATGDFGIGSVMSLQLHLGRQLRPIGSLNLYGIRSDAFDADDVIIADCVAANLAVAVAAGREIEQRGTAMSSRTEIGTALGIVAERYKIAPGTAFGVLQRISQSRNIKIAELAEQLVRTGDLPGLPG